MTKRGLVRRATAVSLVVFTGGVGAVVASPPPTVVGFFGVLAVGMGFGAFAVALYAHLSSWAPDAAGRAPEPQQTADEPEDGDAEDAAAGDTADEPPGTVPDPGPGEDGEEGPEQPTETASASAATATPPTATLASDGRGDTHGDSADDGVDNRPAPDDCVDEFLWDSPGSSATETDDPETVEPAAADAGVERERDVDEERDAEEQETAATAVVDDTEDAFVWEGAPDG